MTLSKLASLLCLSSTWSWSKKQDKIVPSDEQDQDHTSDELKCRLHKCEETIRKLLESDGVNLDEDLKNIPKEMLMCHSPGNDRIKALIDLILEIKHLDEDVCKDTEMTDKDTTMDRIDEMEHRVGVLCSSTLDMDISFFEDADNLLSQLGNAFLHNISNGDGTNGMQAFLRMAVRLLHLQCKLYVRDTGTTLDSCDMKVISEGGRPKKYSQSQSATRSATSEGAMTSESDDESSDPSVLLLPSKSSHCKHTVHADLDVVEFSRGRVKRHLIVELKGCIRKEKDIDQLIEKMLCNLLFEGEVFGLLFYAVGADLMKMKRIDQSNICVTYKTYVFFGSSFETELLKLFKDVVDVLDYSHNKDRGCIITL